MIPKLINLLTGRQLEKLHLMGITTEVLEKLELPKLLNVLMIAADGMPVSGYGFTGTIHLPKEDRQEILKEIFSG